MYRSLTAVALCLAAPAFADAPRVMTDIAPVQSLAAMVTKDVATPDVLVPPGTSPHFFALRPSDARALSNADVVFAVDERLTPWLHDAVETMAGDAKYLLLLEDPQSETLEARALESLIAAAHDHDHEGEHGHEEHHEDAHDHDHDEEHAHHEEHDEHHDEHDDHDHDHHDEHEAHDAHHDEHDHHDEHEAHEEHHDAHDDHNDHDMHDHDHDHGGVDPHGWLSRHNALAWINVIASTLSEIDPENAGTYAANAQSASMEINAAFDAAVASMGDKMVAPSVVAHDSFQYLEQDLHMNVIGAISNTDAAAPSAANLAAIEEMIAHDNVRCMWLEPSENPDKYRALFADTEVKIGTLDILGVNQEGGAGLYPAMIRQIGKDLQGCAE